MSTIAVRKPGDLRMFTLSVLLAIVVFALCFLALRYAAPAASSGVPIIPCRQCGQGCPCPRLSGASMCGCPR